MMRVLFPALVLLAGACQKASIPPFPEARPFQRAWPVMGTTFQVTIWGDSGIRAQKAADAAAKEVFQVDALMSTYKAESEISTVNRSAGNGEWISLNPATVEVLAMGLEVGMESQGRFDITVGPLVGLWKFFSSWKGEEVRPPDPAEIRKARKRVGQRRVDFDPVARRVRLPKGMSIDLGGIAKGFALDQAAKVVTPEVQSALLDLGGQLLFVGKDLNGGKWRAAVRDPTRLDHLIGTIDVEGGSVSTSGGYERHFVYRGKRYHHLIDPRNGWPVEGVLSVTVWAPTAMEADAWSTALFVAGPEEGRELLNRHPSYGAIWVVDPGDQALSPSHVRIVGALQNRARITL